MAPRASPPRYTVSGASVAALIGYAKTRGVDLASALADAGLANVDLTKPETRVPLPANQRLWERAAFLAGDDDFGLHFAERLDLDAFHLLGHLAATSRTLGEALARVVAFSRLLHDAGRTELEPRDDGTVALYPGCRGLPRPPTRHVAEFNAASAVFLARLVTAHPALAPSAVVFQHAAPPSTQEHRRVFGRPPRFGAPESIVVFDAASLELPVRTSAPSRLGQYLEAYARTLLSQLPAAEDDLPAQVLRAVVATLPSGPVGLLALARARGLTPRTLQRRLAEAGTTFAALVDEGRRRSAEHYLKDETLPLAEISYLLGFRDPGTFHKAFRRWTGVTPGAFRARAQRPYSPPRPSTR
jgi:AraC-like DNA-binding protein